ncbi:MAG: ATP-binding protein [Lachnospiraceae bacterium]|nr:ATP-binding protein [Lachnospiraceae bacterium]
MRIDELIVYRNFGEEGVLLEKIAWLMEHYKEENVSHTQKQKAFYECLHLLLALAEKNGFCGNLWHCYLSELLVSNENSYSCACEITGPVKGSINDAVLHDIEIFKELFEADFADLNKTIPVDGSVFIEDYTPAEQESKVYNSRIRDRICTLAKDLGNAGDASAMKEILTQFYKEYGVGKYGLHKAFRVLDTEEGTQIVPILNIAHVYLSDLVGYESAKKKLVDNTEAFVHHRHANNVLLYGDAGTGKSSSIKGIANEFYDQGLRIIELYRYQFKDLNDIIAQIKNRHYRFIIYMDDLSFEDFETDYKYLKAFIEGGLEKRPGNVLIYATSNRRHLIRENYSDKLDGELDMHTSDTMQEKLSLASRFGMAIYYGEPTPKEFRSIVLALAKKHNVQMPEDELLAAANKWQVSHAGFSGRVAQQFIDYVLGTLEEA